MNRAGGTSRCTLAAGARAWRAWRRRLGEPLEEGGVAQEEANASAATPIVSSEGAVVRSPAEQSLEPFDLVAGGLLVRVGQPVAGH